MLNCLARCTGRKHATTRLAAIMPAPNNVFEMQDRVGDCPWCRKGVFVRIQMLEKAEQDPEVRQAWFYVNFYGTDLLKLQLQGSRTNFYVDGITDPALRGHPIALRCEHIYHLGCLLDMQAGQPQPLGQPAAYPETNCIDRNTLGCVATVPQPVAAAGQVGINIPAVNATSNRLLQLLHPKITLDNGDQVFRSPIYDGADEDDVMVDNTLYESSSQIYHMQNNTLYQSSGGDGVALVQPYAMGLPRRQDPNNIPRVEFYDVLPGAAASTDPDYVDVGNMNGDTSTDETSFMGATAMPHLSAASMRRSQSVKSGNSDYGYPRDLFRKLKTRLDTLAARGEYLEFNRDGQFDALPEYPGRPAARASSRRGASAASAGYLSRADLGTGAAGTTAAGYMSHPNLGLPQGNPYAAPGIIHERPGSADVIDFTPAGPEYAPVLDWRTQEQAGQPVYAAVAEPRRTPSPQPDYEAVGPGFGRQQPVPGYDTMDLPPRREGTVLFERGVFIPAFTEQLRKSVELLLAQYRETLPVPANPQAAAAAAKDRWCNLTGRQIFWLVVIIMLIVAAIVIPAFAGPAYALGRKKSGNPTPPPAPSPTSTTTTAITSAATSTGLSTSTTQAFITTVTQAVTSTLTTTTATSTTTMISTAISTALSTLPLDTTTTQMLTTLLTSTLTSTSSSTTPTTSSSTTSTTSTTPTTLSSTTSTTPTTSTSTTSTTPTTTQVITSTITQALTSTFVTTTTTSTTATTTPTTSSTTSSSTTSSTTPSTTSTTPTTSSTTPTTTSSTTSSTTPTTTTFTTTTITTTPTTTTTTTRTTTLAPTTTTVPTTTLAPTTTACVRPPICNNNPNAPGCKVCI